MQTNEIIAALRCCTIKDHIDCKECPAYPHSPDCLNKLHTAAVDTIEAQQKQIDELEQERRWIPVTERLPEAWQHPGDDEHLGEPLDFIVFIRGALVPTALYFDGKSFIDEAGAPYDVTHWMPLPEPPKEG